MPIFDIVMTKKTKYGIKALIYIYKNRTHTPIPIGEIAQAENIPHKFLESILLTLRKRGVLTAKKGKSGGYLLLQNPEDIYMSDIIRMLSGPIAMVPCVSLNFYEKCDDCPDEELCGFNRLMLEVRDSTLSVLKGKNLVELANQTHKE